MAIIKKITAVHEANLALAVVDRSHALEMRVMKRHMNEVLKSREQSINFLKRAGLLTPAGKVKQLVRA
jgi:hypothetical protein